MCAEAIVLGKAVSEGFTEFESIVSVRHPRPTDRVQEIKLISPCGICRELLFDFAPKLKVIVLCDTTATVLSIEHLLPYRSMK